MEKKRSSLLLAVLGGLALLVISWAWHHQSPEENLPQDLETRVFGESAKDLFQD